jgi:hypothetical protein
MTTKLTGYRKATARERKAKSADVVFTREDEQGREYTIYGATCYESWESWEQWGAPTEVLSDNVGTMDKWRHNQLEVF